MLPYLSVHNLEPDELHVLYLGVLQQMVGSVLFVLCFHVMVGTPTENVKAAWTSICRFYRVHSTKTQFTNMRLSSFHEAGEYPKLKGKGAEIKDLTPALLELWMEHSNPMEQEHLLISGMLQSQCVANDILHEFKDEMLLPLEKAKLLATSIDAVLVNYSQLANLVDESAQLLWSITPKFHYSWHMADRAIWLNPRKGYCLSDESYMKVCKHIAKSCVHGSDDQQVPTSFMQGYRWGLHLCFVHGNDYKEQLSASVAAS